MKIKTIFIDGFGEQNEKLFSLDRPISIFKGSNEAGKTTVLEFIRTILFGFDKRKARKSEWFKPLRGGRHGGHIVIEKKDGSAFRIQRYQDRKENVSVLNDRGQDLGEHILQQIIGGIDREAFEQKYAFGIYDLGNTDDFDVNQKLYDAGLGAELGATLTEFEKDKKELLELGKGTKNRFYQAAETLDGIENQIKEIILKSKDYSKHQDVKKDLLEEVGVISKKIQELQQLQKIKTNLKQAFPVWKKLQLSKYKAKELEGYKNFPRDGKEKLNEIENQIKSATESFDEENKKFLKHEKIYSELIINQELLGDEENILNLRNDLIGFSSLIDKELPQQEKDREKEENELQVKIKELSSDWVEDDLISFDTSLTMIAEVEKFAKDCQALSDYTQKTGIKKYSALIQGIALGVSSLGLFFENIFERFISLSMGAIAILLWNLWISKEPLGEKSNLKEVEFNSKWEEFKIKYNFPQPASPEGALKFLEKVQQAKIIQSYLKPIRERVNDTQLKISHFRDQVDVLAKKHCFTNNNKQVQEYTAVAKRIIDKFDEEKEKISFRENQEEFLHDTKQRRQKHESALKNLNENLKNLFEEVGCDSKLEFEVHAKNAEDFEDFHNDVKGKEENIFVLAVAASKTLENFQTELSRFVPEDIDSELKDMSVGLGQLEDKKEELLQGIGSINEMLKQIEAKNNMEALQLDRSFYIKELKDHALGWCQLRIAEKILRDVQTKYQEEKQPAVLKFAERYFKKITSGKYTKIYVDTAEANDSPVKVLQENALIKTPDLLSGGTKDQLFLSMRLGEIMNHVKSSNIESLPVIFDDILVNSDLERSSKIIDTLSEVSEENQIIYFTFNPVVVEGFSKLGSQCEIIEL